MPKSRSQKATEDTSILDDLLDYVMSKDKKKPKPKPEHTGTGGLRKAAEAKRRRKQELEEAAKGM